MANQTCKYCENEPAAFLISELTSGETVYIGLLCLPPWAEACWADAGLPPLAFSIEVPDEQPPDEAVETVEEVPAETPKSRKRQVKEPDQAPDEGEFYTPNVDERSPEATNV